MLSFNLIFFILFFFYFSTSSARLRLFLFFHFTLFSYFLIFFLFIFSFFFLIFLFFVRRLLRYIVCCRFLSFFFFFLNSRWASSIQVKVSSWRNKKIKKKTTLQYTHQVSYPRSNTKDFKKLFNKHGLIELYIYKKYGHCNSILTFKVYIGKVLFTFVSKNKNK